MREPALPSLDTRLAAIPRSYPEALVKLLLRRIVASWPHRGSSILGAISVIIQFISKCCKVRARSAQIWRILLPYTKADESRNTQGKRQDKLNIEIRLVIPGIGWVRCRGAMWCHVGLWEWELGGCEAWC